MKYNIKPSYKVTDKGTVPADDARTITHNGKVAGTAIYHEWNNTVAITRFIKDNNSEIVYVPCESVEKLDEAIRTVF